MAVKTLPANDEKLAQLVTGLINEKLPVDNPPNSSGSN